MKKNFVKFVSFAFALTLGCSVALAERNIQMKEIKSSNSTLPAITVPSNQVKEKVEEKIISPAVNAQGEVVRTGKETNAPLSNVKNEGNILIKQENNNGETSEIKPNTEPVVEKETSVEKQEGTIFDVYGVKENLKIKTPQNK